MVLFTDVKRSFITQPLFVVKTNGKHCATTFYCNQMASCRYSVYGYLVLRKR